MLPSTAVWLSGGKNGKMVAGMERDRFEALVARAIDDLPLEFRSKLENVQVLVEDWATASQLGRARLIQRIQLLGLYEGVPQTRRGRGYGLVLPDKISIFQKAIEKQCRSEEEIELKIGEVVRHEIAHHFGTDEDTLRRIEGRRLRRSK
jgi:predicted Zn-dependent protease with MMP-like domain